MRKAQRWDMYRLPALIALRLEWVSRSDTLES